MGPLAEVALLFLRLGVTSFGGPAAHVALMEREVVAHRRWLTRDEFLDLVGACNLIPGPNSTELAIHIGHRRAGLPGLVVAGACFILPAAAITLGLAWGYVRYGAVPAAGAVLRGVKPVIVAVVVQALVGLARSAVKTRWIGAVGVLSLVAFGVGVHELAILAGAGLLALGPRLGRRSSGAPVSPVPLALAAAPLAAAPLAAAPTAGKLFLLFAKTGSVLYGSGYVLLAFLRADLVERNQWLTEAQLLDAVAAGQVTPGPVFTTATFVGYVAAGLKGALAATCGIFLPAFFFVAVSGPLVPRMRRSSAFGAVLDGVNVASLALMAGTAWQLGRSAIVDVPAALLCGIAAVLLVRTKVNAGWLVLGGGAIGAIRSAL